MVLPSSARGLCHSGLLWFHGFWRTFAAAGRNPKNRIANTLKTAFWTGQEVVLPSSARGCLCHPSGLLWFHGFWRTFAAAGCVPSVMSQPQKQDCHTLQRVDLARPFLVSPAIKIEIENSLEMALSKAKSGSAWQSHFWQCGTVEPCDLLETRSSLHYANKSKLGFV